MGRLIPAGTGLGAYKRLSINTQMPKEEVILAPPPAPPAAARVAEIALDEQVAREVGEASRRAALERDHRHVGKPLGAGLRVGQEPGSRHRVLAARVGTPEREPAHVARDRPHLAVERDRREPHGTLVVVLNDDLVSVGAPVRSVHGPVEIAAHDARRATAHIHDREPGDLVALILVVEAGPCDALAVARDVG